MTYVNRVTFTVFTLVLMLTVAGCGIGTPAADVSATDAEDVIALEPAPIPGHPAPGFTLQTLAGDTVNLSDFNGQPVILNFWATWCGPCRVEMPHLQTAYEAHQDEGLVILGVNLTQRDRLEDIGPFVDEYNLTFPIVLDDTGDVASTYRLLGQPASVFIDRDGVIYELFQGPINEEFINSRVAELLES